MFKMFMLTMFIINIFFLNFNNPLIMGILIFFQTLNMIIILGKMNYSFWFSYIIFLIFIGGLFILFFYIITLTYNNKFFSLNYMYMYLFIFMIIILLINKNYLFYKSEESYKFFNLKNNNMMNSLKFFNFPNNYINLFLIFYLFILLMIVVKISKFNSGPIKLN